MTYSTRVLGCGILGLVLATGWAVGQEKARDKEETPLTARGRILHIEPEEKRLVIKTPDGRDLTVRITDDSKLLLNNRNATLSQLQEGNRVRISYKSVNDNREIISLSSRRFDLDELSRNLKNAIEKTRVLTTTTRTEYLKRVEQALADSEDVVDDLTDRAEKATGELRKKLLNEAETIRQHSSKLSEQVQKLKDVGNDAWEDLKSNISDTLEKLEKSCNQSQSRESVDARFVRLASEGHLLAIHLGNLAMERSDDPRIKGLGQQLVQAHTQSLEGLLALSKKKGFISTRSIGPGCQEKADRLFERKGPDFDDEYLRHLIEEGRSLQSVFQTEAAKGIDPDLRAYASRTLSMLQDKVRVAQDLLGASQTRRGGR